MALLFLSALVVGAHASFDSTDNVQVSILKPTTQGSALTRGSSKEHHQTKHTLDGTKKEAACEVKLYEHHHESIDPELTGYSKILSGYGDFPLEDFKGTSSVKVSGAGCVAYGFTTANCSGDKGTGISFDTVSAPAHVTGVVSGSDALEQYWGCNDCVRCVRVEQAGTTPAPTQATAPTAQPTSAITDRPRKDTPTPPPTTEVLTLAPTAAPTVATCICTNGNAATDIACTENGGNICSSCNDGYFGTTCQLCTKCPANAAIKTACNGTADAVCQCVPGFAGSKEAVQKRHESACKPCTGKTHADVAGLSACKTCADGSKTFDGGLYSGIHCSISKCQLPSPPESAEIDADNCPCRKVLATKDRAETNCYPQSKDPTCKLKCKEGYTESANVAYTCTAVTGSAEAEFTGGSITCVEPTPTAAPSAAPTEVLCPVGSYPYHSGSHCCKELFDRDGAWITFESTTCYKENFIDCPAGAVDGGCKNDCDNSENKDCRLRLSGKVSPNCCPNGKIPYHAGSHCCGMTTNKGDKPLKFTDTGCKNDDYIDCPAGADDGLCKNTCSKA